MTERRIFIVDDSVLWREALRDAFVERGYVVETGSDGLRAVKRIRRDPPDVILSDFFLPRVDGGRICDFVKGHSELAHIPVVILSGGLHGNISRERYANANAVIAKGPLEKTIELCGRVVDDMFDEHRRSSYDGDVASVIPLTPREITNKLIKLHEYLDVLHRDMVDAIFEVDENCCVARINPAGLKLLGRSEHEILGLQLIRLTRLDEESPLARAIIGALHDGDFDSGPHDHVLGDRRFQTTVSRIHPRADTTGAIIVVRDVTAVRMAEEEQVKLREQLEEAQKLESLGRLAGGVAHDMNNILAGILGLATVVDDDLTPGHPLRKDMVEIIKACERGSELTRNLLGFARRGKIYRQALDLERIVGEVANILTRTLPKKIVIETRSQGELPAVEGDPSQIQHALMNVCLNSADAMGSAGKLIISTDVITLSEKDVGALPGGRPGAYVRIRVIDDGEGMEDETLKRCLEPFYTTKGPDRGTGLGLAMVYGTVTNHGGFVSVASERDAGTTVSLHLPEHTGEGPFEASLGEAKEQFVLAAGKILLVDDEEIVRNAGKRQLEKLGYDVMLAEDGKQAVDLYRDHQRDICLVILDLVMPVMDGYEAFEKLRSQDPEVRVLLASGYCSEGRAEELLARGARGFMQKPFGLDQLLAAMAEALS